MKKLIFMLSFVMTALISCAQYHSDDIYLQSSADQINVNNTVGNYNNTNVNNSYGNGSNTVYTATSNRTQREYTNDGLPVIEGGKYTRKDVVQYDTQELVVHHRTRTIRSDVYEDYDGGIVYNNDNYSNRRPQGNITINNYYYNNNGNDRVCNDNPQPQTIRTQWTTNFLINSATIDNCGTTNMANIARFAREYPYSHFVLYGYADIQTGTVEQNYWLSKKRADKVRDELVVRYGISPNRIEVHYMGCMEQQYGINNLNRCVIIKAY